MIRKLQPDWNPALTKVRADLGEDEIRKRIAAMDAYDTWETIAQIQDTAMYGQPLTGWQASAWGKLCEALEITYPGCRVFGGNIKRPLTYNELAYRVCSNELAARIDKVGGNDGRPMA